MRRIACYVQSFVVFFNHPGEVLSGQSFEDQATQQVNDPLMSRHLHIVGVKYRNSPVEKRPCLYYQHFDRLMGTSSALGMDTKSSFMGEPENWSGRHYCVEGEIHLRDKAVLNRNESLLAQMDRLDCYQYITLNGHTELIPFRGQDKFTSPHLVRR